MYILLIRLRQPWLFAAAFLLLSSLIWTAKPFVPVATALPGPWEPGAVLRVGAPEPIRQATVISPYGPGFEHELVSSFCSRTGSRPEWITVRTREEGAALLERGEIHVLVGFWDDERHTATDMAKIAPSIASGKAYAHFNPVRVQGLSAPSRPALALTDESLPTLQSPAYPVMDALTGLFASIWPFGATTATGLDEEAVTTLAGNDDSANEAPFPPFSLIMDGGEKANEDIILLDPASYALWLPFLGDVETRQVRQPTPYRWFWNKGEQQLGDEVSAFWKAPDRKAQLAELTERYFGFLPRTLRQQDVLDLSQTLAERLPEYKDFILKASRETGVPPLLLVAIIYQESRFDPDAVSETKVRGIMQLTTATARMLEIDRKDPEQCIMGGARYMRDLFDRVADKAENEWDRWFMALAAYNQGMSNLNRTIKLSQELGAKGATWTDLKRAFPLSTTCRGLEARTFVERVRYYHFLLHGLVALAPPEAQNLAPLLGLALAGESF